MTLQMYHDLRDKMDKARADIDTNHQLHLKVER